VPKPNRSHQVRTQNKNNTPRLSDDELKAIVKSVSRYEPAKKQPAVSMVNVYDADRMIDAYQEYLRDLKNNRFITGIGQIDQKIRGIAGGEVLTVIARAGSFKTAMLQNLLKNYIQDSAWVAGFSAWKCPCHPLPNGILKSSKEIQVEKLRSSFQILIMRISLTQWGTIFTGHEKSLCNFNKGVFF